MRISMGNCLFCPHSANLGLWLGKSSASLQWAARMFPARWVCHARSRKQMLSALTFHGGGFLREMCWAPWKTVLTKAIISPQGLGFFCPLLKVFTASQEEVKNTVSFAMYLNIIQSCESFAKNTWHLTSRSQGLTNESLLPSSLYMVGNFKTAGWGKKYQRIYQYMVQKMKIKASGWFHASWNKLVSFCTSSKPYAVFRMNKSCHMKRRSTLASSWPKSGQLPL